MKRLYGFPFVRLCVQMFLFPMIFCTAAEPGSHDFIPGHFAAAGLQTGPFDFTDRFDVSRNAEIVSNTVQLTGLSEAAAVSISGGLYSVNDAPFTSAQGFAGNQDRITLRLTAASDYGQVSTCRLNIGEFSTRFSVRTEDDPGEGWARVPGILNRISAPEFPVRDFTVTDFGAVGDGKTDCTSAFREAISVCHQSGGGRVVVPEGVYLTGAVHLESEVNLFISEKGRIKFSQNPSDYLPVVFTRFEGTECYNYSPFIYAFEKENIAVTGQGTLDGQGDNEHWWPWKSAGDADVSRLRRQAEDGVPVDARVYGEGHFLRPNMIQFYRCKNILIDSVTVINGPMWHIHPVLTDNITISHITVEGHGPNNDGCNPESCRDVLISDCYFNTGDDCIAVKSGRNADGRRINVATENVVIRNCTMKDGHGGVVIGSEISGGAGNIFASDCDMDSPNLDRALRIKTNSIRGGTVEHIFLKDIRVGTVSDAAVRVNFYYGEGDIAEFIPVVRNIEIRGMTCENTQYALRIDGYARSPVSDIRLVNCRFKHAQLNNHLNHIRNIGLDSVLIDGTLYHKILEPVTENNTSVDRASVSPAAPASSHLLQNFPNPFNPSTTIPFQLDDSAAVKMDILNMKGECVVRLVNRNLEAGTHETVWDGRDYSGMPLPSGIYLVRMKTDVSMDLMKLMLLR